MRTTIPVNMTASRAITELRAVRAFRQETGRKTGTALEIASMPVIAVAPEKALTISRTPTEEAPAAACVGCAAPAGAEPLTAAPTPAAISTALAAMNA
ncbi:hypothetical protein [Streptomyces qinglanensis]|uniref:hypothetical protein n=1 Tax=Streptomyces qinglanensis TaxID=943816 RepID=UPI0013A6DE93|nr:hypothetical protein [Streptomyces qinglanensis]